jgi:hypothetical protein
VGVEDWRTGRKRLLELLGLVGVLKDEGVEVSAAADLELDLRRTLGGLLFVRKKFPSVPRSVTLAAAAAAAAVRPPVAGRRYWCSSKTDLYSSSCGFGAEVSPQFLAFFTPSNSHCPILPKSSFRWSTYTKHPFVGTAR